MVEKTPACLAQMAKMTKPGRSLENVKRARWKSMYGEDLGRIRS
jgi:hypothetical protein